MFVWIGCVVEWDGFVEIDVWWIEIGVWDVDWDFFWDDDGGVGGDRRGGVREVGLFGIVWWGDFEFGVYKGDVRFSVWGGVWGFFVEGCV